MSNTIGNIWSSATSGSIFGPGSIFGSLSTTSTDDSSTAIEDKKDEQSSTAPPPDWDAFKSAAISNLRGIVYVIIFGAIGVYLSKVAQSNILPGNIEYAPYTTLERIVQVKPISVNITNITNEDKSVTRKFTAIQFNKKNTDESLADEIAKGFTFSMLNKAQQPASNSDSLWDTIPKYFSDVIMKIFPFNFMIINSFFGWMNSNLSESVIYIGFPLLLSKFFFPFFFFFNLVLVMINSVFYFGDFYKKYDGTAWTDFEKDDDSETKKPILRTIVGLFFLFLTFTASALIAIFTMLTSIGIPLSCSANLLLDPSKSFGFITATLTSILYKGRLLMALFSIDLIVDAFTTLNNNYGIGCIAGVIFLYFVSPVFKQYIPDSNNHTISESDNLDTDKAVVTNGDKDSVIKDSSLINRTRNRIYETDNQNEGTLTGFEKEAVVEPKIKEEEVVKPEIKAAAVEVNADPVNYNDIVKNDNASLTNLRLITSIDNLTKWSTNEIDHVRNRINNTNLSEEQKQSIINILDKARDNKTKGGRKRPNRKRITNKNKK